MPMVLTKGQSLNMTKSMKTLTTYKLGLSWDANSDLDAVAVILNDAGKIVKPEDAHVAYYGNCTGNKFGQPENPVAGITHSGDARDGSAAGDDETITIDTSKLPADVSKVLIAVTSYSEADPVPFGAAANPVAKMYDDKGTVLFEVKLDQNAAFSTAIEFVMLERVNGEFIVTNLSNPVGSAKNGLEDILSVRK